ncbi:glycosyltransferase [Marinobacter sp.]|uniref:glycosyltransferase n=1 Tax=Marinobacter sp. TaxID=50741 RepID=UPI002B48C787|nr:glycosyltransferase [Marinobacter sp.]HKK54685.1 glycosyltransferase [Marinobacter sp.]
MSNLLESYAEVTGNAIVDQLRQLATPLRGMKVVHVNSTRVGGGVAEILDKLVPLMCELGIDTSWEIITGESDFYQCTKSFHNGLQGHRIAIPEHLLRAYEETNVRTAEQLRPVLEEADVVFIHDPQPAPLLDLCPDRKGTWIWRCHIDVSHPDRHIWRYLRHFLTNYDASVFSLAGFAQALPHPEYLIPPSIDPLSAKNMELSQDEIEAVQKHFGLDPQRPMILQVSRFDRFKDPLGVIQAFRLAREFTPGLQLVLAGGTASDDPEGEAVYREAENAANHDADIHLLLLPPDAHRTINALQRSADIVLQKSLREGFGLTVTEAMWKGRPVIGGDTGGIRLQVINYHTGFLVNTPEGAALRIRYLLQRPGRATQMGEKARQFVRENFLLTRQLREYLTMILAVRNGGTDRIDLS